MPQVNIWNFKVKEITNIFPSCPFMCTVTVLQEFYFSLNMIIRNEIFVSVLSFFCLVFWLLFLYSNCIMELC
jgi:hypothetical protein